MILYYYYYCILALQRDYTLYSVEFTILSHVFVLLLIHVGQARTEAAHSGGDCADGCSEGFYRLTKLAYVPLQLIDLKENVEMTRVSEPSAFDMYALTLSVTSTSCSLCGKHKALLRGK